LPGAEITAVIERRASVRWMYDGLGDG
jgi:hypothetical protein